MGSGSYGGFHSFFHELYAPQEGWYAYLLKGGPGTGKNSLLQRIAAMLEEKGLQTQYISCSADPGSLDAVLFPQLRACVVDATAPHIMEPQYPGVADEIINLGAYWDAKQLREQREAVFALTEQNRACHKRSQRFITSAATFKADVRRLAQPSVDTEKLERYAHRIAAKEFPAPNGKVGAQTHRFFSAITPLGVFTHYETMEKLCEKIYVLEDSLGAVSAQLLPVLRALALGNGLDVISCPCPLAPKEGPEHLLIPQLSLGFFTANSYHPHDFAHAKTVRALRFRDGAVLQDAEIRIGFTRKAQKELLEEAVDALAQAKQVHDELEAIYSTAMDFSGMEELAEKIAQEIWERDMV